MNEVQEAYYFGRLHENLLQIRNDLHMDDKKAALQKVNDALKLMEENSLAMFVDPFANETDMNPPCRL